MTPAGDARYLGTSTLATESVTVAYPGNKALEDVSLRLESSRIHVLLGQNGAGKSSLIRVLSGVIHPNAGAVTVDGKVVHLRRPADASRLGIRVVPQELQLFSRLRVWENITAPVVDRRFTMENHRRLRARATEALALLDAEIDPGALVAELNPAEQQVVAIARAVVDRSRFLILDEPTAALASDERRVLLEVLRRVAQQGVGLLFVSHHLEESLAIGDDISVLRDGRLIWTRLRQEVDEDTLTSAMFGAVVERRRLGKDGGGGDRGGAAARPLLTLTSLRWPGERHEVDLQVYGGEVIGVAGLPGSGANTLNSAILGALARRGEVVVAGRRVPPRVRGALASGLGYIPTERKTQGLFAETSVLDNLCAASLRRYSRRGVLRGREMAADGRRLVHELGVVPPALEVPVAQLSGGNQQKVVVGRWLETGMKVLLADEPTRGVDVAARLQIHLLIRGFAGQGGACLVYSSDLEELVDLADSVLVFHRDLPPRLVDVTTTSHQLYEVMSTVKREGA